MTSALPGGAPHRTRHRAGPGPRHLLAHIQAADADFGYCLAEALGPPRSGFRLLRGLVRPTDLGPGTWLPPTSIVHRTELARRIGGWRTWEEAGGPPDANFVDRVRESGARLIRVLAMTAFKFPSWPTPRSSSPGSGAYEAWTDPLWRGGPEAASVTQGLSGSHEATEALAVGASPKPAKSAAFPLCKRHRGPPRPPSLLRSGRSYSRQGGERRDEVRVRRSGRQ